jgi:hypothetical protein
MKKGDDAFNARDFEAVDAVHHPNMIAHITGNAEPIYGRVAHAAAMKQMLRAFPDMHVYSDPYPIQFGSGDWITVITRATGSFTAEMVLPAAKRSPRQEKRSTSSSPRPPNGTATRSSLFPHFGTLLCRRGSLASPNGRKTTHARCSYAQGNNINSGQFIELE